MNRANHTFKAALVVVLSMTAVLIASLSFSASPSQAQANTPTPIPAVGATTAPAAGATGTGAAPVVTPGSKIMTAYAKAKAALAKSLGIYIGNVANYTFEIIAFTDSGLNCSPSGTPVIQGYVGGYSFVYTLFNGKQYEVHTNVDASTIVVCPTVGGAAAGGGVAPVSGHITGGFETGGQVAGLDANTNASMKHANMKWVKFQAGVGDGAAAGQIAAGHGAGFKVLISLVGSPNDVLNSGYDHTYASYAASVASSGADAIEVWNEQNLDRQWAHGHIDPVAYVGLLSAAFNAIHTANPNTMVISGALAPTGAAGPGGKTDSYWNDDTYYAGMAAAGASNYADCIGAHYNEGIVAPNQTSGDPRDNYPTRYFLTMLNRASSGFSKPVCFTELGYLTPQGYSPLPGGFAWAQNTTIAQQASWLAQAAVLASQSGHVRLMIVFNINFKVYGADPQAGYAMIRADGSCPACDSLSQVSS